MALSSQLFGNGPAHYAPDHEGGDYQRKDECPIHNLAWLIFCLFEQSKYYLAEEKAALSSQLLSYGPAHHGTHHAPHHEGGDNQRVDEISVLPAQIYVVVALI